MTTWTPRFECPSFSDPNYVNTGKGGNNPYPSVQDNGCVIPNCTGYAYGRELEAGSASGLPTSSNAIDWYNAYTGSKGNAPALGGVVCFGGGYGHVGVVEQIVDANTIVCSESNYGGVAFELVTRTSGNDWKRQGSSHPYLGCLYCNGTDAAAGGTPIGGLPSNGKTSLQNNKNIVFEPVKFNCNLKSLPWRHFSYNSGMYLLFDPNYNPSSAGSDRFDKYSNQKNISVYIRDELDPRLKTILESWGYTINVTNMTDLVNEVITFNNGSYIKPVMNSYPYLEFDVYNKLTDVLEKETFFGTDTGANSNDGFIIAQFDDCLIPVGIDCTYYSSSSGKITILYGHYDTFSSQTYPYWKNIFEGVNITTSFPNGDTTDPNNGTSNSAGGNKSDVVNDDIDISGLPSVSALGAGMFQMFNPNASQIAALSGFLWSSAFSLDSFKKLFSDPMQAILSLSLTPATPAVSTATDVIIGNVSSGINMPPVTSQYVQMDMGSVTINEIWGNSLDYSPTTRVSIYLPYIGIRQLDVDDVMRATLHLVYNIDLFTGQAVAQIHISRDNTNSVLYEFSGNVNTSVPLTASNYSSLINGIMSAGLAIGATAVSGGAAAPAASLAITSGINVMGNKSVIQRGGSSNGNTGALGQQTPYLIFQRPVQSMPEQYAHLEGFPANYSCTLGSISGYTEVEQIVISGTYATDEENKEIEILLKGGVYL